MSTLLRSRIAALIPGTALSAAVMGAGILAAGPASAGFMLLVGGKVGAGAVSAIPLALVGGAALNNSVKLPASTKPGIDFAATQLLRTGVVCVGFKLSLSDVLHSGLHGLPVAMATVASGLVAIPLMAKAFSLSPRLGALLAAGTSICGVTAIVTLAPLIRATPQEVAIATANVVVFGLGGMLFYPVFAHGVFVSAEQVGVFLGTAVHDTSQVLGAALSYAGMYGAESVVHTATVTKLGRNLCLAPVLPLLAYRVLAAPSDTAVANARPPLSQLFPSFIAAFFAATMVRTAGDTLLADNAVWTAATTHIGGTASAVFLGTAMAGVGLKTNMAVFRGVGYKPFACGFLGASLVAGVALTSTVYFV